MTHQHDVHRLNNITYLSDSLTMSVTYSLVKPYPKDTTGVLDYVKLALVLGSFSVDSFLFCRRLPDFKNTPDPFVYSTAEPSTDSTGLFPTHLAIALDPHPGNQDGMQRTTRCHQSAIDVSANLVPGLKKFRTLHCIALSDSFGIS